MSPLSKVVMLGIATGGVAWLPLMWFEAVPRPLPAKRTSPPAVVAPSLPAESIASPDQEPTATAKPVEAVPATLQASSAELRKEPKSLPIAAPLLPSIQDEALPRPAEGPPTIVRLGEEGQLPPIKSVLPSVQLRQPERVAVANFETPIVCPAAKGETGTIRLMHDLNDGDSAIAANAAEELTARGFTEAHLQLARQFTSSDSTQRAKLAAQLPGVAGIDAKLWLTWLLRDEAAEVRYAALGVLATTGDPDTLRRVIEIARQDRDPRIQQQVEHLEKSRRSR